MCFFKQLLLILLTWKMSCLFEHCGGCSIYKLRYIDYRHLFDLWRVMFIRFTLVSWQTHTLLLNLLIDHMYILLHLTRQNRTYANDKCCSCTRLQLLYAIFLTIIIVILKCKRVIYTVNRFIIIISYIITSVHFVTLFHNTI